MSKTRKILFIVLLLIAAVSIGYSVFYFASRSMAEDVYDKLRNQVVIPQRQNTQTDDRREDQEKDVPETDSLKPEPDTEEDLLKPREPKQTGTAYVSPIDFEALRQINSDIFAWIDIPDTNIQFPIVQHPTENNYYLDHTIEGYHARVPGSIYTFSGVAKDFSDFNTMIYGHNMYNGTMFSDLYMFQNRDYVSEHPKIYIYTPDAEYVYDIFGAVVYDDRLISSSFDFSRIDDREDYIESLDNANAGTLYLDEIPVSSESHIITLSTCIRYQERLRLLITAVREEKEEFVRYTGLLDG